MGLWQGGEQGPWVWDRGRPRVAASTTAGGVAGAGARLRCILRRVSAQRIGTAVCQKSESVAAQRIGTAVWPPHASNPSESARRQARDGPVSRAGETAARASPAPRAGSMPAVATVCPLQRVTTGSGATAGRLLLAAAGPRWRARYSGTAGPWRRPAPRRPEPS